MSYPFYAVVSSNKEADVLVVLTYYGRNAAIKDPSDVQDTIMRIVIRRSAIMRAVSLHP